MANYIDTILAAQKNLKVYRGDTLKFDVYFYEDEFELFPYNDLSLWNELEMTVRRNTESVDVIFSLDLTSGLSVSSNVLSVDITPEQMNLLKPQYVFDVQGTKTDGTVGTVWRGEIANFDDVTK